MPSNSLSIVCYVSASYYLHADTMDIKPDNIMKDIQVLVYCVVISNRENPYNISPSPLSIDQYSSVIIMSGVGDLELWWIVRIKWKGNGMIEVGIVGYLEQLSEHN